MRTIVYMSVILLSAVSVVFGQNDLFTPMKGTATPSFQMSDANQRCLVFGKHIVKMTQSEDGGENVVMWDREGTAKETEACEVKARPYSSVPFVVPSRSHILMFSPPSSL